MFGRNRPKPRVLPQGAGYALKLDERERALIRQILGDMRALLMLDADDLRVRRLYPAAYADDAEKEDEYRRLTHEELRSARLANVDTVEASIDAEVLTEEQLTAWMQAINSLRLVLGTLLDISEAPVASQPTARKSARMLTTAEDRDARDEHVVDAQLEAL